MEIWLDSIDLETIADAVRRGVIRGVTTNPTILAKAKDIRETLVKLLDLQPGQVAVQVTAADPQGMIEEGLALHALSSRILVKVPVSRDGLIAIKELKKAKISVLGTGVLFPTQALLAANLAADYIAPYFSRIATVGDAFTTLKTMVDLLRIQQSTTKFLVASLKDLDQLTYCATLGVDIATIKPDLYQQLIADHPVSEGFIHQFLCDWRQAQGTRSLKDSVAFTN